MCCGDSPELSEGLQFSGDPPARRILSGLGFGDDAEAPVVHSGWRHSRCQAESEGVAILATTGLLPRSLRASSSQGVKRIGLKRLVAGCVLACVVVSVARWTPAQGTGTLSGSASISGAGLLLPSVHALVSPGERQGLVNLYLATNGSSWRSKIGWSSYANASVDPCTPTPWSGVTCGAGGVTLPSNLLRGSFPTDWGNMSALRYLYLDQNSISGSFPSVVSGLGAVQYLDLRTNFISGSFPSVVSGLGALTTLDLSGNSISGSFPSVVTGLDALQ